MTNINIAIDGPAGAGKSTIAKRVSKELGCIYMDTGAMYRTVALYYLDKGIDIGDEEHIRADINEIDIRIKFIEGAQHVFLNGRDVSTDIRREDVGNAASAVSVYGDVRKRLVAMQQEIASKANVVMDGRDIGTVVLPDANVKIYLTASVKERARRRAAELEEKGQAADIKEIEHDIEERDYRDMHRDISPLKQAEDAILVDSTEMSIDEVVAAIISICKERAE